MVNENTPVYFSRRTVKRDIFAYYLSEIIAIAVIAAVGLVSLFASMGGA